MSTTAAPISAHNTSPTGEVIHLGSTAAPALVLLVAWVVRLGVVGDRHAA